MAAGPTLDGASAALDRIAPYVDRTPVHRMRDPAVDEVLGDGQLYLKLEFLQRTGTFKARAAIHNVLTLSEAERARGVVAVSAGNHAIAVSYAAQVAGVSAKVVMHEGADPYRVTKCRSYGGDVILAADIAEAFTIVHRIRDEEGRAFLHPFDGLRTLEGTATVGLEIAEQVPRPDAVIVAVGGGGLIAGVGAALRAVHPEVRVIGVEPVGAAGMAASLAAGSPLGRVHVDTIADSMGAPMHTPGTFEACREVIDAMVAVDDDAMCREMCRAYDSLKFVLEPAGAAALAAVSGPLRDELRGRRVVALLCGSNIGEARFARYLERGRRQVRGAYP